MEYENDQQAGWWQHLKDSPRTVSALIIILVVAAAIYAFSGDDQSVAPIEPTEPEETTEAGATPDAEDVSADEEVILITPMPVAQETLIAQRDELPEAEVSLEGYTEAAQAGDGATHLARRAATRYLAENTPAYAVTNEHRIYIEDYIQKKMGSPRLEIGEERAIPLGLVAEAVEAAGNLKPSELNNLSQYTSALN